MAKQNKNNKQCAVCKTDLVLRSSEITQDAKDLYMERYKEDLPIPKGYRCPKCGQCHDKMGHKLPWKLHLGKMSGQLCGD